MSGHLAWLSERLGIPPWGQIFAACVVAVSLAVGGFIWNFNGRMSRMEGQMNILVAGRHIDDAALYAREGNVAKASAAVGEARKLIAVASRKRTPASPEYFENTIEALAEPKASSNPQLAPQFQQVRLELADYRSAIQNPVRVKELMKHASYLGGVKIKEGVDLKGGGSSITVFVSTLPYGQSVFLAPENQGPSPTVVSDLSIIGPYQALDGLAWKNVTFINTHVVYRGGNVILENVRFVNCTFEAPATDRGERFTQYVALLEPTLSVNGL